MIEPQDEDPHPVGPGKHWQESWYFNWADPHGKSFGLSRIGFRYNENRIDGLVLTLRDGRPEYIYPGVSLRPSGGWQHRQASQGIEAGRLTYRAEEPLRQWSLTLAGRDSMNLIWTAFTPAFDFGESPGELPPNVAQEHFEQSGVVTGWTRFKGRYHEIRGYGQRDKSWGVRDWAKVEGWNWITAQFGEAISFNAWEGFLGNQRYFNGFVYREGKNHAIDDPRIVFEWGRRKHLPRSTTISFSTAGGERYEFRAETLSTFPLVKNGLWLEEVHALFSLETGGGSVPLQGIGVIEHAWHAGTWGTIANAGDLARAGWKVLRG